MAREGQGGLRGAPTGPGVGVLRRERQAPPSAVRVSSVRSSLKGSTVYPIMVRTIVGLFKEGFDRFDRQMIPKMRRLE